MQVGRHTGRASQTSGDLSIYRLAALERVSAGAAKECLRQEGLVGEVRFQPGVLKDRELRMVSGESSLSRSTGVDLGGD